MQNNEIINRQIAIKKQITSKLNDLLQKRLRVRIQQKLQKHYTNCKYSTSLNRFYVCNHKNNLSKNNYVICSDSCMNCKLYQGKYNVQDKFIIQQQFFQDINNPATCGNKQPKIAILIWVLKLLNGENENVYINQDEKSIWKKIKKWFSSLLKNGSVQK